MFCVLIWCGPWVCRGRVLWEGESRDLVRGYGSVICLLTRVEQQLTTYTHAGSRSRHKNKIIWGSALLARDPQLTALTRLNTTRRSTGPLTSRHRQRAHAHAQFWAGGIKTARAHTITQPAGGSTQRRVTSLNTSSSSISTILHLNSAALRAGRTVSERRLNQLIQQELYPKVRHRAYDGRS